MDSNERRRERISPLLRHRTTWSLVEDNNLRISIKPLEMETRLMRKEYVREVCSLQGG